MNKKTRNIIIAVAVVVGIFLLIFIGLMVKRNLSTSSVDVYPVSSLATDNYEDDMSNSSGSVKSEGFQNIVLSETQKVKEILVSEGDTVSAGDVILTYDTTLSDLDIEKADIALQKLYLDLSNVQNELDELYSLEPAYEIYYEVDNSGIEYKPLDTPYHISGKGTEEDPMYWLIDDKNTFDKEFFQKILPKDKTDIYVVFVKKDLNALNAQLIYSFALHITATDDKFSFSPYEAYVPEEIAEFEEPIEPWVEEGGSPYTEAEIAEMIAEKQTNIRETEAQIKVAELQLEKLQKEISKNEETVKEDGKVIAVRDPDKAFKEGQPVVEISSGGGFYINVYLNELELANVKEGDTVSVSTYNSMKECEGTITKIAILPAQNTDSYSNGNPNVSYYPFTVFVPGEEGLYDGEYANVAYNAKDETDNSFYLDNMYIRKDNGSSYVYVENEAGEIEQRFITTGRDLWGSYTQIKDGLSYEDFIAFPYGKDVKNGAKANEADVSSLFGY